MMTFEIMEIMISDIGQNLIEVFVLLGFFFAQSQRERREAYQFPSRLQHAGYFFNNQFGFIDEMQHIVLNDDVDAFIGKHNVVGVHLSENEIVVPTVCTLCGSAQHNSRYICGDRIDPVFCKRDRSSAQAGAKIEDADFRAVLLRDHVRTSGVCAGTLVVFFVATRNRGVKIVPDVIVTDVLFVSFKVYGNVFAESVDRVNIRDFISAGIAFRQQRFCSAFRA